MKTIKLILIYLSFVTFQCFSQTNYNQFCFTGDISIGNGIYGIGSIKIGTEVPIFQKQKIGFRIGAGLDISNKIGAGLVFSPYQFKYWDFLIGCDLTRMFGDTYLYHNDKKTYTEDLYSFDNTNLVIPSITFRIPGAKIFTFHITFGWAFGLNNPNIEHLSGPNLTINQKNINNRLVGGSRFEFGGTIRLRKWKK